MGHPVICCISSAPPNPASHLRSADASFQRLWGRYSQDSGRVELLAEGQEACVPTGGDPSGLYPISLLDPEAAFAVADLRYLEPLSTWLQVSGWWRGVAGGRRCYRCPAALR